MAMPEIRSILVASDLGDQSDLVLRAAAGVARRTGARLHAHHVLELNDEESRADTFQAHVAEAERRLADQCARAAAGICETASARVEVYEPHLSILDRARDVEAGLIVLGPPKAEGFADRLLATTNSDRVIRGATVPCLVVRGAMGLPLGPIVCAVDLADPAGEAVAGAVQLAARWGGDAPRVEVLHVVPRVAGAPGFELERARLPELLPGVSAAVARAGADRSVEVSEEVLWGDSTAGAITGFAAEVGAGLVVMGTHARGALARAMVGSVSAAVVRTASSPVLLLPPSLWTGDRGGMAG